MSRAKRKRNKEIDLKIKGAGDIGDLLDNQIKLLFWIDDAMYNFICETSTDDELNAILDICMLDKNLITLPKIKLSLQTVDNILERM